MQGAFFFPCSIISLTLAAPTPTNISTKSDPEIVKKGTLASPAIAFASKVLPVPGGPIKSAPFGIFPPNLLYFVGSLKNSTISSLLVSNAFAYWCMDIFHATNARRKRWRNGIWKI